MSQNTAAELDVVEQYRLRQHVLLVAGKIFRA